MYCVTEEQFELQTSWILKVNIFYCSISSCITFIGSVLCIRTLRQHPIFHDSVQMLLYLALVICNIHDLAHIGIQWSILYRVIYYADDRCSLFVSFSDCIFLQRTELFSICGLIYFQSALTLIGLTATFLPKFYHAHRKTPGILLIIILINACVATNYTVITLEDEKVEYYAPSCQFFTTASAVRANIYLVSSCFLLIALFLINLLLLYVNINKKRTIILNFSIVYNVSKKYQTRETTNTSKAISLFSLVQLTCLCAYSGGTWIFRQFKERIDGKYYYNVVIWVYAITYVTASFPFLIIFCVKYVRNNRRSVIRKITNHKESMEMRMDELKNMWNAIEIPRVSAQLASCLNSGTPLNSTNCQCPGFVTGKLCETVKCQRYGVLDRNRCSCPPGWYDKYCGIRGCRPANEDNLNLEKRSFIIVFNTKTTMSSQLETLKSTWINMTDSITTNLNTGEKENWIENFIFYGFVQRGSVTTSSVDKFDTAQEVLDFLKTVKLAEGDDTQPVLSALKSAQQTIPTMRSHGIVLVFTDSPASDAPALSHRFAEGNVEQLLYQIILDWRAKVSFILTLPENSNFTSDGIDVYRRLTTATHGDMFHARNSSDIEELLKYIVGFYYFPENLAVGYAVSGNVTITPQRDNEGDVVFTLITTNGFVVPGVENGIEMATGPNFRLFFGRHDKTVSITSNTNDAYNYRVFIQSKRTILFDYNDDMTIDVGNTIVNKKISMTSTVRTFGFDFSPILNHTYHVTDAKNVALRGSLTAWSRPQLDCTFQYGFDAWSNTQQCPSGPIIQIHNIIMANATYQRVIPGYCDDVAHFTHQTPQRDILPYPPKKTDAITPQIQCTSNTNFDMINDPRLSEPNQFIFILELHKNNEPTFELLSREIGAIVNLTDTNPNNYNKEYTLIVHDDKTSRVLLSHYSAPIFAAKFSNLIGTLQYIENLDNTMGLLSIVQAQKSTIRPTSQIFYFTNQAVKNVQNVARPWDIVDRNLEINIFTIADNVTTEVFAMPSELELVQKMSNGRIIPLTSTVSIAAMFRDMVFETALTTDHEKYNCHDAPYFVDAYMERDAVNGVVQLVGTGIYDIRISDPNGNMIDHTKFITYSSANFYSINIDLTNQPRGIWRIGISTTRGGCQIQVRHRTTTCVLFGFTNSSTIDTADSQIPLQRSSNANQTLFVAMRVTNQDLTLIPNTNLQVELVNRQRYDMPEFFANTSVLRRDDCAFNMMSLRILIPRDELTFWTLTAFNNNGELVLRRVFYYYQHIPADPSPCNGGQVNSLGQCICPTGYTGEYCHDRLCVNGATRNFHICSCNSGFLGDFCEIELMENDDNNNTTPTTSPISTTTSSTHQTTLYFVLVLCLLFNQ